MEVENDCRFRPSTENYLTIISFCIIFFLSVIGNSIVVVVILQVTNLFYVLNFNQTSFKASNFFEKLEKNSFFPILEINQWLRWNQMCLYQFIRSNKKGNGNSWIKKPSAISHHSSNSLCFFVCPWISQSTNMNQPKSICTSYALPKSSEVKFFICFFQFYIFL